MWNKDFFHINYEIDDKPVDITAVGKHLKQTDWNSDQYFLENHNCVDRIPSNNTNGQWQITDRLVCKTPIAMEGQNRFSINDYLNQWESTMNQNMEEIINCFPNKKFAVGFSGGIDSSLIAAWCLKNKVDFVLYHSAYAVAQNKINDWIYQKNIKFYQDKGIKTIRLDVSNQQQETMNYYINCDEHLLPWSQPIPCYNQAGPWSIHHNDEYVAIDGEGGDFINLHGVQMLGCYINNITNDAKKDFLRRGDLGIQNLLTYDYHLNREGERLDRDDNWKFMITQKNLKFLGGSAILSWHKIQKTIKSHVVSPFYDKNWFDDLADIDCTSINKKHFIDLMNCTFFKNLIRKWIDFPDLEDINHVACQTKLPILEEHWSAIYQRNLLSYILQSDTESELSHRFKRILVTLEYFNKITIQDLVFLHFYNWTTDKKFDFDM